jgi:hypothetical protein
MEHPRPSTEIKKQHIRKALILLFSGCGRPETLEKGAPKYLLQSGRKTASRPDNPGL